MEIDPPPPAGPNGTAPGEAFGFDALAVAIAVFIACFVGLVIGAGPACLRPNRPRA